MELCDVESKAKAAIFVVGLSSNQCAGLVAMISRDSQP